MSRRPVDSVVTNPPCTGFANCRCRACRPLARTDEAANFLAFDKPDGTPDRDECVRYLKKKGVRLFTRGRTLLVKWTDLEALLEESARKSA